MGDKSWRICNESEFYRMANEYVENHLEKFMENLDVTIKSSVKKKEIWKKYNVYRRNSINSVYKDRLRMKIDDMLEIVLEDVNNWVIFSTNPDTPLNEIMLRMLINSVFQCNYVSNLYISANPHLTEDFIEDCIYVASDLFNFNEWDDEHVEAVTLAASQCIPEYLSEALNELYDKKRLCDRTIPIRLNLEEFCYKTHDPLFKTKYFSYLRNMDAEKKRKVR